MKIGLLGSTGFIGKTILNYLLKNNFDVKVLVRNAKKLDEFIEEIEIIEGSLQSRDDMNKFTYGCDIIINALGGLKDSNTYLLFKNITTNIVSSIEKNQINKLIPLMGHSQNCLLFIQKSLIPFSHEKSISNRASNNCHGYCQSIKHWRCRIHKTWQMS